MEFKTIIKDGINRLYPNLNSIDFDYLNKRMYKIIELLYYQYNLNKNDFEYQLMQNDYKDIKWLITILLPYLNVDSVELKSFNNLYLEKLNTEDINKVEPIYKFSNLQYGRCNRKITSNGVECEEIKFSYDHLDHNFYLFLESLIISSNKLYVNWQNIIPVTLVDLLKDKTYINTQDLLMKGQLNDIDILKIAENDFTEQDKKLIGSLYVGDIYNTIRNYLYEEIKEIKLLIFDIVVYPEREKYTAISILNDIFKDEFLLEECLNDKTWDELNELKRKIFDKTWKNIINTHILGNEYSVNYISSENFDSTSYYISRISMERLLRGILVGFEKRFATRKNVISSGYISIKRSEEEMKELEQLDEDDINLYKFDNMYENLKSIKTEYIYEFFREILQDLKKTYYSHQLLTPDKKNIQEAQNYEGGITIKNYYNFAKSLTGYVEKNRFYNFNKNWKSLENSEKKIILDRLNDKNNDVMSWFNIGRYIQSLFEAGYLTDKNNIEELNKNIYNKIRSKLIYIVCEILITKGVLSKFIPNKEVTDQKYISGKKVNDLIKNKYFKRDIDNKYATKCYYYLTELPYIETGQILEILSSDSWYTMQAMEWVSQLGFCHHFINNRVSYVTGATGVGKSTHVPKLYLYYLKGIDYLSVGKVVCTQPRKTPTEKNSDEVSKQLGLPIVELDDKNNPILDDFGKKISIENYSVQMQHQDKKHVKNLNQLVLKFITDGSLVMEFKNILPLFKKQRPDKKPTNMNLYDVVIVDEAHEHNKNMDILLTLLKIFSYYNPSLRVVILSATMDEDEPNYRRFYRAINDNQKYPLSTFIRNNKIDRINVDRRFHISAPGTGTRFTIGEEYKENYDIEVLINELVKTRKGDILVFQPGEADINNLIKKLNTTLPDNWIALPFYSTMSNERRNFIENIDFQFPTLKMNRQHDFNTVSSIEEGNGYYTNFVLIATNIAEASITIKRLYYVIDTGIRKINYYDYKKRNNKLQTKYISETSRLQRKGRVGRTGAGEAYFLYKKGINVENKTPAEISILNISSDIYSRLRETSDENKFNIQNYYDTLKFMYETRKGKYDYVGNLDHNDYSFKDYIPEYYETGFKLEDLIDNTGKFYIVHPDELNIKRNIFGTIVKVLSDEIILNKDKIESYKMNSFIEDFVMNNYIEYDIFGNVKKTEFGTNVSEIIDKFKLDNTNYAKLLIYSILNSCEDKVINIVALLNLLRNGDIINLFTVDKITNTPNLNNVIGSYQFRNCTSDYDVLSKIIDNLYESLKNTNLLNLIDIKKIIENDKLNNEMIKIKGKDFNINSISSIYNNFIDDDNRDREDVVDFFINRIRFFINNDKFNNFLTNYCNHNNIEIKSLKKYFTDQLKIKDIINSLYYPDKRNKSYKDFLLKYKNIFKEKYSKYDPFKVSIVMTYSYNIIYSIKASNSFLPLYYPVSNNIVGLDKIKLFDKGRKKYINKLFIDEKYSKELCIYENYNPDKDIISNITYLENSYIKLFKNIYNSDKIKEIIQKYKDKLNKHINDKYIEKIKKSKEFGFPLPKDYTIISNVYDTYNDILKIIK